MQVLKSIYEKLHDWRHKIGIGFVAVLVIALGAHVIFGANGWVVYRQKVKEHERLQKEVKEIEAENERLQKQINNLKTDPKAIEKEAREQLKYARPGEVIYVMPERKEKPATATAEKR